MTDRVMRDKRPKRDAGDGYLKEQPDGTWRGAIVLHLPTGSTKRVWRYGPTRKSVNKKLQDVRDDHDQGLDLDESKLTVEVWLKRWLKEIEPVVVKQRDGTHQWQGSVRYNTYRTYAEIVNTVLLPRIGKRPLKALRPDELSSLYKDYADRSRRADIIHATVRRALNEAVRHGKLARNPAQLATKVRYKARKIEPPTTVQFSEILAAASKDDPQLAALIALMGFTGCRPGEVYGLRWSDIDDDRLVISIRRTRLTTGTPTVEPLKTASSARDLPVDRALLLPLSRLRAWQAEDDSVVHHDVFAEPDGTLQRYDWLQERWKRLMTKLGLSFRPYDLRHLHATTLLERGVPLPFVSQRLGHANSQTTANTYSHLRSGESAKLASIFADALVEAGLGSVSGEEPS
jgi:integrase